LNILLVPEAYSLLLARLLEWRPHESQTVSFLGYEKASRSKTIPALNTLCNIGALYRDQGKMDEAENFLQRSVWPSLYTGVVKLLEAIKRGMEMRTKF
jgi:hypothetical protein